MAEFDEKAFQEARLIPVIGIKGAVDQERRATSALLAVIKIVPELTYKLCQEFGAPKWQISTYIEPAIKLNGKTVRPDGLIVITRGKTTWRALVEVKTGKNDLDLAQVNSYLDVCRDFKIDALLTISNQVLNASGAHPTDGIDQRKLRGTTLGHLSWLRVITESIVLKEHVGVEDTEREMVLSELIRFLQSEYSGASEFNDMGSAWTAVREAVRSNTLKKPDADVLDVVSKFESLMRYSALTLTARLGVSAREVTPKLALTDYKKHLLANAVALLETKRLSGVIAIPGSASNLEMTADVGSGNLHCRFTLAAPQDGRNKSRISWLVRQLKETPVGTSVSWSYKRARVGEKAHLVADLADKSYEYEVDNSREVTVFTVELMAKMGTKRTAGQGGFITSVVNLFELSYGQILQPIRPWQAAAPRLSETIKDLIPDYDDAEEFNPGPN